MLVLDAEKKRDCQIIYYNKMFNKLLSSLQCSRNLGEELCWLEMAGGDVDVQYLDWCTRTFLMAGVLFDFRFSPAMMAASSVLLAISIQQIGKITKNVLIKNDLQEP